MAMPMRPHSAQDESTRSEISRTAAELATSGLFSKARTTPTLPATNHRLESPGGCTMAIGLMVMYVTGSRKESFGNAGSVAIVTLPEERAGATQLLLPGLASSPLICGFAGGVTGGVVGGGSVGGVVGGGVTGGFPAEGGGELEPPPPPPPQPASMKMAAHSSPVVFPT